MVGTDTGGDRGDPQKLKENDDNLTALTAEETEKLLGAPELMPVIMPTEAVRAGRSAARSPVRRRDLHSRCRSTRPTLTYLSTTRARRSLGTKQYLSTLSVQEAFVVYFKVSIICGDRARAAR